MTDFTIGDQDSLFFDHQAPGNDDGVTFIFFNALTGDTSAWEAEIGPELRDAGHGTLMWNFRGQKDSPFSSPDVITANGIVEDSDIHFDRTQRFGGQLTTDRSVSCLAADHKHFGAADNAPRGADGVIELILVHGSPHSRQICDTPESAPLQRVRPQTV